MYIIVDSGSTNTDWRIVYNDGKIISATSEGLNPLFLNENTIGDILKTFFSEYIYKNTSCNSDYEIISDIYFYGAGIVSEEVKNKIFICFRNLLVHTDQGEKCKMHIWSDLRASALALFGHKKGIACILGTGANSGIWDGKNLVIQRKAGGYILGDEGSGAYLGKLLLGDYIKDLMPENLKKRFEQQYNLDYASIVKNVYNTTRPSKFLGSFSYFYKENIDNDYIKYILLKAFDAFFERFLEGVNKNLKVSFAGSIAKNFEEILTLSAENHGFQIGIIVDRPIDLLINVLRND